MTISKVRTAAAYAIPQPRMSSNRHLLQVKKACALPCTKPIKRDSKHQFKWDTYIKLIFLKKTQNITKKNVYGFSAY